MVFPSTEPFSTELRDDSLPDDLVKDLVKELSETQLKLLHLIIGNKHISKKAMAQQIGKSTTTIDNHIEALKKMNIIQRIGGRKTGYWQIIEQK